MPKIGRRAFVAGSASAVVAKAIPAAAQDFPARPITLIIPFPPGGSTTIVIRSVSDKLGEALNQQIVTQQEYDHLLYNDRLRRDVVKVDDFPIDLARHSGEESWQPDSHKKAAVASM